MLERFFSSLANKNKSLFIPELRKSNKAVEANVVRFCTESYCTNYFLKRLWKSKSIAKAKVRKPILSVKAIRDKNHIRDKNSQYELK